MKVDLKINIGWILTVLLASVIIFLLVSRSNYRRDNEVLSGALEQVQGEVRGYVIVVDSLQERVVESNILYLSSDRALKESVAYSERLEALDIRRVSMIGSLKFQIAAMEDSLIVRPATVAIPAQVGFNSPDAGDASSMPEVTIALPVEFGWDNSFATSYGSIGINGLGTSGFELKDVNLTITMGSRGLFRPEGVVAVSTPNPYLVVSDQSVVVVSKKKAPWLYGTIGAVVGGVVTYFLVK